jgi:hypothetical protein
MDCRIYGANGVYSMLGFLLLGVLESNAAKYFACFLITCGIYPNVPMGVAWNGNNIGGSLKRGVGIAMHVGFGNLGGTMSGFLFRPSEAPHYKSGHFALLATTTMSFLLSCFMTWYLRRENARRDRENKAPADYTREEMVTERESGDNATFFRYTV